MDKVKLSICSLASPCASPPLASTPSVPYISLTSGHTYAAPERSLAMPNHPTAYQTDSYAWTQEQARLLDARQFDALDVPNLVEEITSLGKSEQRELYHRLSSLLEHLLKLVLAAQHSPQDLQRAGRGWRATVKTQRLGVAKVLRENPSLRTTVPAELAGAYAIARVAAAAALEIEEARVHEISPWPAAQVLAVDFMPAA